MAELYYSEPETNIGTRADENHFDDYLQDTEASEMVGHQLEQMDALRAKQYTGRHKVIYQDSKGKIVLTLGPHWFMFFIGCLGLIGMGCFTIYNYWNFISTFKKVALVMLLIVEACLYTVTALLNPGIKSRRVPDFGKSVVYCTKCLTTREDKVVHCQDCDVCIEGHDHHCIWTGKCIGKGNFAPFIFFIVCTPVYLINMFMIFGEHS